MGLLKTPINRLAFDASLEPIRKSHYVLRLVDSQGRSFPEDNGDSGIFHVSGIGDLSDEIRTTFHKPFNTDFEIPVGKAVSQLQVTIRYLSDKAAYSFFSRWFRSIYNEETGEFGLYNQIVGSGLLELYSPDGRFPLYQIRLLDVYPKTMTTGAFESEDDGGSPATWGVTLSVGAIRRQ